MSIELLTNINLLAEPVDDEHVINIAWVKEHVSTAAELIPNTAGTDLNNYRDPGEYYNPASPSTDILNQPTGLSGAFALTVEQHAGRTQTYTSVGGRVFKRSCPTPTGAWGAWAELMAVNPLTEDYIPVQGVGGLEDSAFSQTATRVTSDRPELAITTPEDADVGQTTTLFMNNRSALRNFIRLDWDRTGQSNRETRLRNYTGADLLVETNYADVADPPNYEITEHDTRSNSTVIYQRMQDTTRELLRGDWYRSLYQPGGYVESSYGQVVLRNHNNGAILSHSMSDPGTADDQWRHVSLNCGNTVVFTANWNPYDDDAPTSIRDGWGRERIWIGGQNTAIDGVINFRRSRLQNILTADDESSLDDVANIRAVRNEINKIGQGYNKGELFPAGIVANRATMISQYNAMQETVTEEFESASATVGVWTGGVLPVVTNTNNTSGFERSDVRAVAGTWSIRSRNFNLNNVTSTIVFDLGVLPAAQILTWQYWIQAETCCDYMLWAVLNSADGTVVYNGQANATTASGPVNWLPINVDMRPERIGFAHQLRIQYRKDSSVHGGEDRLYIDQIRTTRAIGAGGDRAWAFPDGAGVYVHGFAHAGILTELRMSPGQSFRDTGAGYQLKMWNGTSMVNV